MSKKKLRLLTVSEAARALDVSESTIRRWTDLGYLRCYRTPGAQRRFRREHLEQFVREMEAHQAVMSE